MDAPKDVTGIPGSIEYFIGNWNIQERTYGRFPTTHALVDAFLRGDPYAAPIWMNSIRALAATIATYINVLDPEAVIIGGGIARSGKALFEPLEQALRPIEWQPAGHKASHWFGAQRAEPLFDWLARLHDAVEEFLAAQVQLVFDKRWRRAEGIIQAVHRKRRVLRIGAQDHGGSIAPSDINAIRRRDRRGKNEIANPVDAKEIGAGLARERIQARQDVLIVADHVERSLVKKRRRNVRSVPIDRPDHLIGAGDVALRPGETNTEHRLFVVADTGDQNSLRVDR
jgi:hypothetical protein